MISALAFCAVQLHYRPLEANDEGRTALLVGLEYLIQISFVNDDEVGFPLPST